MSFLWWKVKSAREYLDDNEEIVMKKCIDCGRPAKFKAKTYDGKTIYVCEEHVKRWVGLKITKLISIKTFIKSLFIKVKFVLRKDRNETTRGRK